MPGWQLRYNGPGLPGGRLRITGTVIKREQPMSPKRVQRVESDLVSTIVRTVDELDQELNRLTADQRPISLIMVIVCTFRRNLTSPYHPQQAGEQGGEFPGEALAELSGEKLQLEAAAP